VLSTSVAPARAQPDARCDRLTNTHPGLRRAWHPVARSTQVTALPIGVCLLGQDWVFVRLPDPTQPSRAKVAAFVDRCPHRLAPLSAGFADGEGLHCRYHGWCFDADGTCVDIPSSGGGARRPARSSATPPAALAEHHGLVWLAPEPPLADLLTVPECDDAAFAHRPLEPIRARVGAGLMLDNFLDIAHFPFVHPSTIGTAESAVVETLEADRVKFDLTVHGVHPIPHHEDPGVVAGVRPLLQERALTYRVRAPFQASLRIDYLDAGGTNVVDLFVQPEDDEHSVLYSCVHRNDMGTGQDEDRLRLEAAIDYERTILAEDLAIQEQFLDRSLPLDPLEEIHVRADRMTVELRRMLRELVSAAADVQG